MSLHRAKRMNVGSSNIQLTSSVHRQRAWVFSRTAERSASERPFLLAPVGDPSLLPTPVSRCVSVLRTALVQLFPSW